MPQYTPPLRDMQFVLHELLDVTAELKHIHGVAHSSTPQGYQNGKADRRRRLGRAHGAGRSIRPELEEQA